MRPLYRNDKAFLLHIKVTKMKIVFAGSPEYSLPTLRSLCACGEVVGVLTQPDKPVGRKKILTPTPVKQYAAEHGIPVLDLPKIRDHVDEVRALGGDDSVTSIAIYATDFDGKEELLAYLDAWNDAHEREEQITYSDTVGLLMGMVQQILNIITYVLVAFTAISLVVSSVMIGIITYVSVVERVKEIGVLRSLGARKQDVRNLFNAETFIIGFAAGVIGVGLSYFLSLFINIIIQSLTGISGIAALPFTTALIMVAISIVLTLISGLIPAQSAAKKDPVIALRTE